MQYNRNKEHILFLGDGSWGTTLAVYTASKGYPTTLWSAFQENINTMTLDRENKKFLPGIPFPENLKLAANITDSAAQADVIVLATPSQYLAGVLDRVKNIPPESWKNKIFLSVVKGIETKGLKRVSQLVHHHLGHVRLGVLSGPTIASEVARKIPSSAVIACKNLKLAKSLQTIFHSETFRIYTNTDVIGVELGGSLKNVIAIACGVCDGLGFGANTKSAILARGLAEMARLGKAMGAQTRTFSGLAGLGDLVTTCFSPQSRNRTVGEKLGKGDSIDNILGDMVMVAEGVETAKAVQKLAKEYHVDVPISSEVYRIIYNRKKPEKAVSDLMTRRLKSE